MKIPAHTLSDKALLLSILRELKEPFKSKSVRDHEARQPKVFRLGDLVYNHMTKEDGTIRRVYMMNGAAMYEVAVPQIGDSWAAGYAVSDWADDFLQLSTNKLLKSLPFKGANRLS
jgi:hypothetical protein